MQAQRSGEPEPSRRPRPTLCCAPLPLVVLMAQMLSYPMLGPQMAVGTPLLGPVDGQDVG